MYNKSMAKRGGARRALGFTIIEVMLSLAISGMVLVGALLGVSSTISRQRYRDVVESTAAMLRNQYDLVTRIQIDQRANDDTCGDISGDSMSSFSNGDNKGGRGRSKCSVYGVAITLGLDSGKRMQVTNLIGIEYNEYRKAIAEANETDDPDEIIGTMTDLELLKNLKVTNLFNKNNTKCQVTGLLTDETYKWDATLETTTKDEPAEYIIMIVRSPRSGAVHTFTMNHSGSTNALDPYDYTKLPDGTCSNTQNEGLKATISDAFSNGTFTRSEDVKLCINSADMLATYGKRRMIKIEADGHNSSAVVLTNMDDEENECQ